MHIALIDKHIDENTNKLMNVSVIV